MINYGIVETLYKKLTPESKKSLLRKIFGDSNQSLAYFKRTKDTTFSKVEILADCLNVPVDALRQKPRYRFDSSLNEMVPMPSESIDKSNKVFDADKEELILKVQFLENTLALKEDHIALLMEKVEFYKERLSVAEGSKKQQ